jgi:hypothetical protein
MQLGFYDAEKVFRVSRRKISLEWILIKCFFKWYGFLWKTEF